jgi:hypothetical protein
MDDNPNLRNACNKFAEASLASCGDAIHDGFINMQICMNSYNNNNENSVRHLFEVQKKLSTYKYLINTIVPNKLDSLKESNINNPDILEVELAFKLGLNDYLGITIGKMLYSDISHVTERDIKEAKEQIDNHLNEDAIFSDMLNNSLVTSQFESEFQDIAGKFIVDENDFAYYTQNGGDKDYNQWALTILKNVNKEKATFLKERMKGEDFMNSINDVELKPDVTLKWKLF